MAFDLKISLRINLVLWRKSYLRPIILIMLTSPISPKSPWRDAVLRDRTSAADSHNYRPQYDAIAAIIKAPLLQLQRKGKAFRLVTKIKLVTRIHAEISDMSITWPSGMRAELDHPDKWAAAYRR